MDTTQSQLVIYELVDAHLSVIEKSLTAGNVAAARSQLVKLREMFAHHLNRTEKVLELRELALNIRNKENPRQ